MAFRSIGLPGNDFEAEIQRRTGITFGGSLGGVSSTKSSIGSGSIGGTSINTPSFSFSDNTLSRTDSEFLDITRRNLADLEAQRSRIGGAFSEFTTARLQDVENARARTVGNLRSQLGRRGILGASFAGDAITRTELDFQNQEDKVRAEAQVQEFGLELENLKTQQQASQAALTQELRLLDIGANISSNLLNASLQRQRIAADIAIATLGIAAAAAGRRRQSSGGVRLGGTFSRFGPGGQLGSFSRFSSAGRGGATFSGGVSPFIIGSSGGATQGATIPSTGPFVTGGFTPAG